MTKRKAGAKASEQPGSWIDETVPDLSELLAPHDIDASTFSAWLGPLLGNYRFWLTEDAKRPTRSDQRDALRHLAKDLAAARAHLVPGHMPPDAVAHLQAFLFKAGKSSWHEIAARMRIDLVVLGVAAQRVASMLEEQPAKRGRKASTGRDALLNLVIDEVRRPGMSAADARALASRILERCRVEMPESADDETIKKAAARGRLAGKK